MERYGVDKEDRLPPIKVVVVEGKEDITIKISDEVSTCFFSSPFLHSTLPSAAYQKKILIDFCAF